MFLDLDQRDTVVPVVEKCIVQGDCGSAGRTACPMTEGFAVQILLPPSPWLCPWARHVTLNWSKWGAQRHVFICRSPPIPKSFHKRTVATSPVSHLSCKWTQHLNLPHPHSVLFTCTPHGHPDLSRPYLPTAWLCRDTGEARQALRWCMVPLENLTAERHGVSSWRRKEEWRTVRDDWQELICGLGCEQRHTANYWTQTCVKRRCLSSKAESLGTDQSFACQ